MISAEVWHSFFNWFERQGSRRIGWAEHGSGGSLIARVNSHLRRRAFSL